VLGVINLRREEKRRSGPNRSREMVGVTLCDAPLELAAPDLLVTHLVRGLAPDHCEGVAIHLDNRVEGQWVDLQAVLLDRGHNLKRRQKSLETNRKLKRDKGGWDTIFLHLPTSSGVKLSALDTTGMRLTLWWILVMRVRSSSPILK